MYNLGRLLNRGFLFVVRIRMPVKLRYGESESYSTEPMIDRHFSDTISNEYYHRKSHRAPRASVRSDPERKFLHFMIHMIHEDTDGDDSYLLRGEVLTILAMMRNRMKHPIFRNRCIIPARTSTWL